MSSTKGSDLLVTHNWFSTNIETRGDDGHVHLRDLNADIYGPAIIRQDRRGSIALELQIDHISPETIHPLQIMIKARGFETFEADVPEGRFSAPHIHYAGFFSGNKNEPAHVRFVPQSKVQAPELILSDEKPVYWALPLSNFLSDFMRRPSEFRDHCLRIDPAAAVISFTWQDRPAFIEPLLDYAQRESLLQHGEQSNLLTAMMVGEVGDHLTDAGSLNGWFPDTLLYVLSFLSGNVVGAPWVEFRNAEGKLVKRTYRHLGSPTFTGGHRIIEEVFAPNTAKLLNTVQATAFCQTPLYRVLLRHAVLAGAGDLTIDDRLGHLFPAFDRLCQAHGLRTVILRNALDEPEKSGVLKVLNTAFNDINALVMQAQADGNLKAQKTLERIAMRVKAADETDRDFGSIVCLLAQHFGFQDEAALDTYLQAHPLPPNISTWRRALTIYRNADAHDAFFDTSSPIYAIDKLYGMNLHLLDLLIRILLTLSGYDGPYHPIAATLKGTQKSLGWVTPNASASELGYDQLL